MLCKTMYSHVFIWGSFGEFLKGQARQLHRKFTPPSLPEKGGILFGSTESMFGSASEIHILVLVGSPYMDWNRLTAFALLSARKYPHQTVHQLKLTHLLM